MANSLFSCEFFGEGFVRMPRNGAMERPIATPSSLMSLIACANATTCDVSGIAAARVSVCIAKNSSMPIALKCGVICAINGQG